MKKILSIILAMSVRHLAFANSTTPVLTLVNVGTQAVPPAADFPAGIDLINVGNGTWTVGASICGMAPGAIGGTYHDWGSEYSASGVTVTCGDTNVTIVAFSGPVPD